MLQEVRKTSLVFVLEDGTYLLGDVEIGLPLRFLVVSDVVGKPIVKLAHAYLLIYGDRRHLLLCKSHRAQEKRGYEKCDFFHNISNTCKKFARKISQINR